MIPQETLDWLASVGARKFDQPILYHADNGRMLYSECYLAVTPLAELQRHWYNCVTNAPDDDTGYTYTIPDYSSILRGSLHAVYSEEDIRILRGEHNE
jgi:hypothetical protein